MPTTRPRHAARPMLVLALLACILLALTPTAQAAWSTSASAPASFRPDRSVTFTYTATSSSATDLPLQWRVSLATCQDLDNDAWCEPTDAHVVDHGERQLSIVGGGSQTVSWTVSLANPEGVYRYHFHTTCTNNPCTGIAAGGQHNRTGAFQLAYTNTWTRQILASNPVSQGTLQSVSYRMMSTSPDDRDLAGQATLHSRPPGMNETNLGEKPYTAPANAATILTWQDVAFPEIGTHELRASDTNALDTRLDVTVRGVHLHTTQPRSTYAEGATWSLYLSLEGHGATPDPAGIVDDIDIILTNDTFPLLSTMLRTDANGRAHLSFQAPHDATRIGWRVSATGTWNGIAYALERNGNVTFESPSTTGNHASLEENVTRIHEGLETIQLKGVHLDELGARNVWMLTLRASGGVLLVILLVLLVIHVAFRV